MQSETQDHPLVSGAFLEHCTRASLELGIAEGRFEQDLLGFLQRCQEERKVARDAALSTVRAQRGPNSGRINASPYVLLYRLRNGLELYWAEVKYDRAGKKIYQRVPHKAAGGPDMRTILAKALPEEVEVIRRHEDRARRYRSLWTAYVRSRRTLNLFVDGVKEGT